MTRSYLCDRERAGVGCRFRAVSSRCWRLAEPAGGRRHTLSVPPEGLAATSGFARLIPGGCRACFSEFANAKHGLIFGGRSRGEGARTHAAAAFDYGAEAERVLCNG